MRWVIADAKGAPDHLPYPLAVLDLSAEAVRLWSTFQERGQLRELLGGEARLPTRRRMAAQPVYPLLVPPLEPLADGARRHTEGSGDILLFPALLLQLPGASSPPLAPVELGRLRAHPDNVQSL